MAKKLQCYFGFHKWQWMHTDGGERHQACAYCGKERPELLGRSGGLGA
jgi:hypothetical protein